MKSLGRFIFGSQTADPASPENGEVWQTSNRLRTRLAGVTRNLLSVRNDTGTVEDQLTWSGAQVFNSVVLMQDRLGFSPATVAGSQTLGNGSKLRQRYTGAGGHTWTLADVATVGQRQQILENVGTGDLTVQRGGTNTITLGGIVGLTSFVLKPGQSVILNTSGTVWEAQRLGLEHAGDVAFTPTGGIAAASVQAAIAELDSEKIPKSIVDASGDLLVGTANDVVGRLAIGANGKVLGSHGGTPGWIGETKRATQSAINGTATGAWVDLTGCSLSLDPGVWLVCGNFLSARWWINGGLTPGTHSASLLGSLWNSANTVEYARGLQQCLIQSGIDRFEHPFEVSQIIELASTTTVKLRGACQHGAAEFASGFRWDSGNWGGPAEIWARRLA